MPWLSSSLNKVQTNVFCCCLNFEEFFFVLWHYTFLELLRATKTAWDFFGVNFWSKDFFGFCWKPQGFFWVLTFGSIRSSPSLEIPSTPPSPGRFARSILLYFPIPSLPSQLYLSQMENICSDGPHTDDCCLYCVIKGTALTAQLTSTDVLNKHFALRWLYF